MVKFFGAKAELSKIMGVQVSEDGDEDEVREGED